jgi:chromate reductase, NAD(P)H dehydrogenase (quinone)
MTAVHALLMCGNLQVRSANRAALDVCAAALSGSAGAEVSRADVIATIPAFGVDRGTPAPVAELRAQIECSNVVIVATPEYAGGISGSLKNALDWLVGSGDLYGMPAVVLSAATTGGVHDRAQLVRMLTWQGAYVVGELAIAGPKSKSDPKGRPTDRDTIDALRELATLAARAPSLSREEIVSLATPIVAGAGIDPGRLSRNPE